MESSRTLVQAPRAPSQTQQAPRERIVHREHSLVAGALVLDRYRLSEPLGAGGFGVVWRAHDETLRREVAVKRVWLGAEGGPIDAERAGREALAAARLSHPAIVALHEACAVEDAFYLISELVEGDTLAQLVAEDALADEEIMEIGVALADALAHAHARGVVHRDIKPQNVLVPHPAQDAARAHHALQAAAKLTDFGGASLAGEDVLTRTGDVLGTLAYMAPEQSEGHEAGPPADLYSLALVIYEALCGENPVRAGTPAATVRRIGQRLPPLERSRRDLPRALTRALDRALAPVPAERGGLRELRGALAQTLERGLGHPRRRDDHAWRPKPTPRPVVVAAPSAPPEHPSAEDGEIVREPESAPTARSPRLPRAIWLAGALLIVCWQIAAGRPGVGLLALAALLPLAVYPAERRGARLGVGWLAGALAPVLGIASLAGAYPVLAGQAARWRDRAALGALGYWWLLLAEPLFGRRLWLGSPSGTPVRAIWEGSLSVTAAHVVYPLLTLGALLGALLWAAAAMLLPWIARGHRAALDIVAVTVWSAALAAATPALDAGLSAHGAHPDPRGVILGAVLGGVLAVVARALRGPV